MKKTIGMLAHVDAGKTTLAEQLLYHTKSIKHRGRVDHKDTFLDSHEIERQRGITVFADQAMMTYNGSSYYLIDTPGHVDFSPEMERAMQVMDYAILVISAVEGIEGHTETVWQLLRKHNVPTFFFINKVDRVGADVQEVMTDIKLNMSEDVFDISETSLQGKLPETLIEFIAERDEWLLEHYLVNGYDQELWLAKMRDMLKQNKIFPCAYGSALQDIGIETFLEKLDLITETSYKKEEPFAGRVYKIRYDENGTRITFIKALNGKVKTRDEIQYGDTFEKVTQLRVYNGNKYKTVDQVAAGELFGVVGLTGATTGDGVGAITDKANFEMVATLKSKVNFEQGINIKEALSYFKILDSEDPSLNVLWEESLQQIHIHVMGTIQLEVLEQEIKERFGLNVKFSEPEIIYKETIATTVNGYGHFEPLGHYAEVHVKLEPGERNSGIRFFNQCHADDLSVGHQNLVRHHLFDRDHHGLLTGSALTDVKVTLLTGRAHNKHTSGGDFREATFRAIRQGLEKAENILLEPIYQFKIKVEMDHLGRVLSDLQTAFGKFDPPWNEGNKAIITGTVPVATFMDYSSRLAGYTQGRGSLTMVFAGYDRCHNEKEVIEQIGYDKNADFEYTSSSIFCSKGQGYTVPWDKAEEEMHCL